jgi:hypothetical protein
MTRVRSTTFRPASGRRADVCAVEGHQHGGCDVQGTAYISKRPTCAFALPCSEAKYSEDE